MTHQWLHYQQQTRAVVGYRTAQNNRRLQKLCNSHLNPIARSRTPYWILLLFRVCKYSVEPRGLKNPKSISMKKISKIGFEKLKCQFKRKISNWVNRQRRRKDVSWNITFSGYTVTNTRLLVYRQITTWPDVTWTLILEGIISDIPWQNGVEQQIQKNLFVVDNYW